jgi:uncharacterized protein YutE (UPF0331/DUF86 family)
MTDPELLAKRLAALQSYVEQLRRLGRPELLTSDVKEERFILHTLQLAMQSALDVASHIVSDEWLGEPEKNRDLFLLLARDGWIDRDLAIALGEMTGMRNILVHEYLMVDLEKVQRSLDEDLDDLLDFADSIRRRLTESTAG